MTQIPWYKRLFSKSDTTIVSQLVRLNMASWSARTFVAFSTEAFQQNGTVRLGNKLLVTAAKACPVILVAPDDKVVPKHAILDLLAKPNPNQSWTRFLENAITYRLIGGEAPIWANRLAPARPPRELWVLRPDWLNTPTISETEVPRWVYQPTRTGSTAGNQTDITASDLCMWAEFNPQEPMRGLSLLWSVAREIDILNEYNATNKALLDNGMQPSGVFSTEQELAETPFKRLKADIDERYSGSKNSGRPVLLEGGLKWQQSGLSPRDAEFSVGSKNAKVAVLSILGIPAQLADIDGAKTFANFEQARAQLYEDTVIPMVNDLLATIGPWLMTTYPDLRDKGYTLRVDVDAVAALEVRRSGRMKDLDGLQSLRVNEKRRAMGYEDDPDGNVILVDSGKIPLELAGADIPSIGGANGP